MRVTAARIGFDLTFAKTRPCGFGTYLLACGESSSGCLPLVFLILTCMSPVSIAVHKMASRGSILRLARTGYRCSACRAQARRRYATAVSNDYVNVIEVGPRDGLQNEKNTIPLNTKLDLIHRLAETGIRTIEAGSFVSPKWTPQVRKNSVA